jgi:SOS response regulatory protein OraA/RecX
MAKPTPSKRRSTSTESTRGRLTALRPRPRDPSLVDVYVDNARIGTVLREAIELLGLHEGASMTGGTLAKLTAACERAAARTAALRLLSARDRSGAMLERHLIERTGVSEAAARATCSELRSDGWQDDRRYAEDRAQRLVRERHASHALVVATLEEEGIPQRLAKRVATSIAPTTKELARAIACAKDLLPDPAPRRGDRAAVGRVARRVGQHLARRGFSEETVLDALAQIGLRVEADGSDL